MTHVFPADFSAGGLSVFVSTKADGTMLDRMAGTHAPEIVTRRQTWVAAHGVQYEDVVYQRIVYDEQATYDRLAIVDGRMTHRYTQEVVTDGLITDKPGVSLMLPVADCVATVLYDKTHHVVALLHLGRHSCMTDILTKAIAAMAAYAGTRPGDISAWLSPSAQKQSYKLDHFDQKTTPRWRDFVTETPDGIFLDLQGRIVADMTKAGVSRTAVAVSPIDTMTDDRYFSHAAGDTAGRFVVMATLAAR